MPEPAPQPGQSTCCIKAPVHFWSADSAEWTSSRQPIHPRDRDFAEGKACVQTVNEPEGLGVTVIVAKAEVMKKHTPCLSYFQGRLGMPLSWFTEYSRKSNGYFGSEILTDEKKGSVTGVTTWCRFIIKTFTSEDDTKPLEYKWDKLNMFTRWDVATGKTTVVIFTRDIDRPIDPKVLFSDLERKHLRDPFWMYPLVLGDIADKQHESIWTVRSAVRAKEKAAEKSNDNGAKKPEKDGEKEADFRSLHVLARHAIHGTETLDAAIEVTESIIQQHKSLEEIIVPSSDEDKGKPNNKALVLASHRSTHSSLHYHLTVFKTFLHRSVSTKERLLNEINLAFNVVAQSDATASLGLAVASRQDSAAMKTIAFVTTAFLPATFIAAIFSTSFFNFEQGTGWAVSTKFWIYWIFAVPVTVVAIAALDYWQKRYIREDREKQLARMTTWGKKVEAQAAKDPEDLSEAWQDVESGLKRERR